MNIPVKYKCTMPLPAKIPRCLLLPSYMTGAFAVHNGDQSSSVALADHRTYQLLALTFLYVSVKVFGQVSIDATMMEEIGYGAYRAEEIVDTEMIVMEVRGWRMNGPTPQEFACLLLGD